MAAVEGPDAAVERAFHDTALTLKRRLALLMSLSLKTLDTLAMQREVRQIGQR